MTLETQEFMRRAMGLHQSGNMDGVIKLCNEALQLTPDNPEVLNLHGIACGKLGRKGEAVASLKLATTLDPGNPVYHQNLGRALQDLGDLENAEQALRTAVYLAPSLPQAHANLGNVYKQQKKLKEAVACYDKALALSPGDYKSWNNLGNTWRELKDLKRAEDCMRRALAVKPDFVEALSNLGVVLSDRGVHAEAIEHYEKALKLDAKNADLYVNYGNALREAGRDSDSRAAFAEAAVKVDPKHGGAWSSLGNAALATGEIEYAGECYRRAVELSPGDPPIHFNLALYQLLTGDLKHGFAEYEWGLRGDMRQPRRPFRQPMWRGEDFRDQTLLVYAEQGIGDMLQFIRFLPQVKARGGRVVFEVQQGIGPLLEGFDGADQVIERRDDGKIEPAFDKYVALLSLPTLLDINLENCNPVLPYIKVPERFQIAAREKLNQDHGFKVALSWYGNPAHKNDRNRSIALEKLKPLVQLPGVSWYAFTPGERSARDIQETGLSITSMSLPFPEAAALINEMDLTISVDSAHVHLAGALGRPAWALLPFAPDWRWLLKREDSPWYPTVQLFRQPKPGKRAEVIEELRVALAHRLKNTGHDF